MRLIVTFIRTLLVLLYINARLVFRDFIFITSFVEAHGSLISC